jgi:hypothetical protein
MNTFLVEPMPQVGACATRFEIAGFAILSEFWQVALVFHIQI